MINNKTLNEGYTSDNKQTYGYQGGQGQRGYTPNDTSTNPPAPPKTGSKIERPNSKD